MKKPDVVLRELGQLYDFRRELAKFHFKPKRKTGQTLAVKREPVLPRPVLSGK